MSNAPFNYDVPLDPQSPWPKFKRDAGGTGRSPVAPTVTAQKPWEHKTELGVFSPAVIDGDENIYIGSGDHVFYCFRKDGSVKWSFRTGEIIDSSALLDDRGRVYVPSSDAHVYALDRETGEQIWSTRAETVAECHEKGVNSLVDWFEGHATMTPHGHIVAPNDNFHTYCLDRETGDVRWSFVTGDQTWSCPALNADTGRFFMGTNYFVLRNFFAFDASTGRRIWKTGSLGSMVASPLLVNARGRDLVVGAGFDGIVRAFCQSNGRQIWKFGARDHVYGSPVLARDNSVIVPSADGTIYCLSADRGKLVWSLDTPEPIRSTPAVDGAGNVYFGNGEGKLYCLGPDGAFRWSYQCVQGARSDVNSSPALGREGIVVGCDDGTIVRVPYAYPLTDEGREDPRCETGRRASADGPHLHTLSRYGKREPAPPTQVHANQPLSFALELREAGAARVVLIEPLSVEAESTAGIPLTVSVSADKRFITVVPGGAWGPPEGRTVELTVNGLYKIRPRRFGLKMFGGRIADRFARSFRFTVRPREGEEFPFVVGTPCTVLEVGRLAPAMPTILPSYNQLGFDSIHYHLSCIERTEKGALLWGVGAKLVGAGEDRSVVDPDLQIRFAVHMEYDRGLVTLTSEEGFTLEFNGWDIPYDLFRISGSLATGASAAAEGWLNASVRCDDIAFYGPFLKVLGVSEFRGGMMHVAGGVGKIRVLGERSFADVSAAGAGRWSVSPSEVRLTLSGCRLKAGEHNHGILLVNAETGAAMPLNYTKVTRIDSSREGEVTAVAVELPAGRRGGRRPSGGGKRRANAAARRGEYRAYYLVDGLPVLNAVIEL